MGKLSIEGKAEREVMYNAVELTVTFYNKAKTTAEALRLVMDQSEKFLEIITSKGVNLEDIHIGDNSISQQYSDDEMKVRATKEINIRLSFDMVFINGLMEIISEQDFSVEFDCDYKLTNMQELQTELLKEALADSKEKAEFIANVMNQKIIGIDSVKHGRYNDIDYMVCECETPFRNLYAGGAISLSDKIKAPVTTVSENISVVWTIE